MFPWSLCSLIFLLGSTKGLSFDDRVDEYLEYVNAEDKRTATTSKELGNITLGNLNLSGVTILGLDSKIRTGPSYGLPSEDGKMYTIHLGFRYLEAFFRRVTLEGRPPSVGSCRIWKNSLGLCYRLRDVSCEAKITSLRVEQLSDAILVSSDPLLDKTSLDDLLQNLLLPKINEYLESKIPEIQEYIQRYFCPYKTVNQSSWGRRSTLGERVSKMNHRYIMDLLDPWKQ